MKNTKYTLHWDRIWNSGAYVNFAIGGHIMGTNCFIGAKRMKAMNNWSGDSDNEEYGPSNTTVYWSTNGYYSKSIGNRTDICGNVGIQNCYVILAYDVGETFTDNASNTLQQEDLSKPFGDISKNIITNPRYMVGANSWIYGVPSSASRVNVILLVGRAMGRGGQIVNLVLLNLGGNKHQQICINIQVLTMVYH